MNIKDILNFESRAVTGLASDEEIDEHLEKMGDYLNQKSEEGTKIVLSRMNEEDFVRMVREVKRSLMVSMLSQEQGGLLTMADMAGDLDAYTHTIILSVLAILAEEEVI
jgi:hypothetical protein